MPNEEKLSEREAARLAELEDTIANAEINREQALLEVHDSKLYREYGTFVDYCLMRWTIGESHAYRLLDRARVTSPMGEMTSINERQSRELKGLNSEQANEVIKRASGSGAKLTAAKIKEARAEVIKVESPRRGNPTPEERKRRADEVARLWQEGYNRDDIRDAMGIGIGTIQKDLASLGIGSRPVAGLKPQGHPIEAREWRDQPESNEPNVIRLKLVPGKADCDLDRESADRMINNADAGSDRLVRYIDDGYELTESQVERLIMIRDRIDRLVREAAQQKEAN